MHKILLIDDDIEVLDLNLKYLKRNGYSVSVATNPVQVIKILNKIKPDCIILDVMMPEMNGFVAFREIRKHTDAPVIFLTGRTGEDDKINGLLLGADDYITKPYSLKELAARILVSIRRFDKSNNSISVISFPPLTLDIALHKAYCDGEEIQLSNREFELLYHLAKSPNQTITFQQLGEKIWGTYREEDRRSIMVNASRLRKKLGSYMELDNLIETVWSQGYKLVYNFRKKV